VISAILVPTGTGGDTALSNGPTLARHRVARRHGDLSFASVCRERDLDSDRVGFGRLVSERLRDDAQRNGCGLDAAPGARRLLLLVHRSLVAALVQHVGDLLDRGLNGFCLEGYEAPRERRMCRAVRRVQALRLGERLCVIGSTRILPGPSKKGYRGLRAYNVPPSLPQYFLTNGVSQ
jgi:hypothetical protein